MERHAGGSWSIPTVYQLCQRREVVGSPATDKAVKHDRSTTGARSTAKLSHHFFLILNWFFICFRCHALSSRSLGFGLHSPNLFVSHLAVLSRWYKKAISHWSWVFLRLGAPLARLNLKKAFDQSEVARQQVDQSLIGRGTSLAELLVSTGPRLRPSSMSRSCHGTDGELDTIRFFTASRLLSLGWVSDFPGTLSVHFFTLRYFSKTNQPCEHTRWTKRRFEGQARKQIRNNKTEHKDLKASGMESTLEAETSFAVTTTAVNVQCVHKLQVRIVTSRKQYVDARAEQYVGGDKFSEVTKAGFCHAQHSFYIRLTATVRSSARPFGDDPFWHAVHGATSVNTQFHKNTVHDPHTNACL